MGRAVDLIHSACNDIIDDITLIHDESYMLHIFDELLIDLPEFKAFMDYEFKNKMSKFTLGQFETIFLSFRAQSCAKHFKRKLIRVKLV